MDDESIIEEIDALTAQEHALQERAAEDDGLSADDQMALLKIETERDRRWDLIRQRRALREAGKDPDTAVMRPPGIVEGYRQ